MEQAIGYLEQLLPSFAVVDAGKQSEDQSCILIEKGRFYGMGYVSTDIANSDMESLKNHLTRYPENDYIRGLVYQYVERNPQKKRLFGV